MFNKGDRIEVTGGKHSGKRGWFMSQSRKPGAESWCFIQFEGPAHRGAQVHMDEIRRVD